MTDVPPDQLSTRCFDRISAVIERSVGIRLPPSKRVMLEGRLRRRVQELGLGGLGDYCRLLFEEKQLATEYVHLVNSVTTNKTDFFREREHFAFLRDVAVPALLALRGGRRDALLKIWSAACSTGAEAYTIAMVLEELARASANGFQYAILGTDVSTKVLDKATTAIYPADMMEPVPEPLRRRYTLRPRDERRQERRIAAELRARVRFRQLNLMDATYPYDRDVDVIFCRNVLIYFDRPTQQAVLTRLCAHLRHGGYLILGHSEASAGAGIPGLRQVVTTIWQRH